MFPENSILSGDKPTTFWLVY